MNIYEGLLFLHGHVASAELARQLVEVEVESPDRTLMHETDEKTCCSASASRAPSREAVG
jgi:hypothetical protein